MLRRGYFGLAPGAVREGDVCYVIFGMRSPFILRKAGRAGHFKLVGSVMVLSREVDYDGYPDTLCKGEDWVNWGLKEEDIFLC